MKPRKSTGTPMFLRMLLRAAFLRKRTAISALFAIIVAAAAATAMLNLFVDVEAKLRKEFRGFGANIVVEAKNNQTFTAADLQRIDSVVGAHGLAVPFAYAVAHTTGGQSLVVAGTDFGSVKKLNPWWSVSAWPGQSRQALVGIRAAKALPGTGSFTLDYQSRSIALT